MSGAPTAGAISVEEVLVIADALERAAVARYAKLADSMRRIGHDDLAATFQSLAAEEQLHVQGVQNLLQGRHAMAHPADLQRWVLPETFGVEESGPAALLTPYKALSIAVLAEERAFSFWTYAASMADEESVRAQSEEMARQELVHAAKLRHARRRAYHAEHPTSRHAPDTQASFDVVAARLELARLEAGARARLLEIGERLEHLPDADGARLLREVIAELTSAEPVATCVGHTDLDQRTGWSATDSAGLLFEAVGELERFVECGLEMLNASADAAAAIEFQSKVDQIIRLVARLNARLYALEPSLAEIAVDPGATKSSAAG